MEHQVTKMMNSVSVMALPLHFLYQHGGHHNEFVIGEALAFYACDEVEIFTRHRDPAILDG